MTLYELLLFVHILAAAIWFGSGFLLHVLAYRAKGDDASLERLFHDTAALSTGLFIPSSLVVLVAGVLLVIDGPWSFDQLWIVLGLLGYAATFTTGVGILKPRSERIVEMMERAGGMTPEAAVEIRRMLSLAKIDYITLMLVIAVMALKPTGDDVVVLTVMALVMVAGTAYFVTRATAGSPIGEAAS